MARKPKAYDVRVSDVMTFLSVRTHGSVTAAARSAGRTPSQVSKAVSRLERQLGERLLARSGRAVTLTPAAYRIMPLLNTAVDALVRARRGTHAIREVTVVAPSYLLNDFVPSVARHVETLRVRGVQMAPGAIRAQASLRQFEVALSTGAAAFRDSWRVEPVGQLYSGLFASPSLARKLTPLTLETVRQFPFITPVSLVSGQWEPMDDECPLAVGDRRGGHEAPTVALALAIAAETEHLVFGPRLAARDYLQTRRLVELRMPHWNVSAPVFLAVDVDRITANELRKLTDLARTLLKSA